MSHSSRSLARLAAALGLLATLPFAASAFAAGGKPSQPPAKAGTKPAAAPAAKFDSFAALETAADAAEEAAHLGMRQQRYAQVAAYVAANGAAADIEEARAAAFGLAAEIEAWAKAVEHAGAYLEAHAEGPNAFEAKSTRAQALGRQGKTPEAKEAYEALVKGLDAESKSGEEVNRNVGTFAAFAEMLTDADDVEGAKAVWQQLKDFYAEAEFSADVARLAEAQVQSLEPVGKPAVALPDSAKDLAGKALSLADYKGKVLLIDFWATWCGPCRAEMPAVLAAYKRYHDKGFEILGVSLDRPGQVDKLKAYVAEHKMPWRQLFDADTEGATANAFGVSTIPHTVLIDREGKVLRVGLRGSALEKKLATLFPAK